MRTEKGYTPTLCRPCHLKAILTTWTKTTRFAEKLEKEEILNFRIRSNLEVLCYISFISKTKQGYTICPARNQQGVKLEHNIRYVLLPSLDFFLHDGLSLGIRHSHHGRTQTSNILAIRSFAMIILCLSIYHLCLILQWIMCPDLWGVSLWCPFMYPAISWALVNRHMLSCFQL